MKKGLTRYMNKRIDRKSRPIFSAGFCFGDVSNRILVTITEEISLILGKALLADGLWNLEK